MTQTIEQLTARVRELEEENARLKEIIESHAPDGRNVTNAQHVEMRHKFVEQIATLTRQRDLAVEAITRAIDMVGHPDNITYLQQTLDAIKESEGK